MHVVLVWIISLWWTPVGRKLLIEGQGRTGSMKVDDGSCQRKRAMEEVNRSDWGKRSMEAVDRINWNTCQKQSIEAVKNGSKRGWWMQSMDAVNGSGWWKQLTNKVDRSDCLKQQWSMKVVNWTVGQWTFSWYDHSWSMKPLLDGTYGWWNRWSMEPVVVCWLSKSNLEFGIWNLEFGIWNLEFGMSNQWEIN